MPNHIVLVSDDDNFFGYISPKLKLRKSDKLYEFNFDDIPEKFDSLGNALFIINSETAKEKTLELLNLIKNCPSVVFSYNNINEYRVQCLKAGCINCIDYLSDDEEINAIVCSALNTLSILNKNLTYKELLAGHKIIEENNEVYLDYTKILDLELKKISKHSIPATLMAIAPNEKAKFVIQPNLIETIILSNIRQNDILMNFAPNKYFLLIENADINEASKIWNNIKTNLPDNIYAGLANVSNRTRSQLVNEVLNKLHETINKDSIIAFNTQGNDTNNFKIFRKNFYKKLEQIITPVFYHAYQKYSEKLFGICINHEIGEGYGNFYIKNRFADGSFTVTSPGCTKINIDVKYHLTNDINEKFKIPEPKRITFEPNEFDINILEDLLEQFIMEYKSEVINEYT